VQTVSERESLRRLSRFWLDQEEHDLEGVREADIVELCRRGEGGRGVAGVERAAEATVGRALRSHDCSHLGIARRVRVEGGLGSLQTIRDT
jgi:hypothetical protein